MAQSVVAKFITLQHFDLANIFVIGMSANYI